MSTLPSLASALAAIRDDAAAGLLDAWALSTVIDENTNSPVIDETLFDALHAAAGITAEWPVGNAGLLHVYGYWFSTVETPYGLKRDRWVDGQLTAALGLPTDAFHFDESRASTLLRRVTDAVMPVLVDPDAHAVTWADVRVGDAHTASLQTRAVLVRPAGASATALVYGVDDGCGMRLVTVFPIQGETGPVLEEFVSEPRLRWNAAASDS